MAANVHLLELLMKKGVFVSNEIEFDLQCNFVYPLCDVL